MAGLSMEGAANAEESATVWRRFMAAAYESVILFGVVFFFSYAFSSLFQIKFAGELTGSVIALQLWLVTVLGFYFVWFWSQGRRTLPMKTMGLKLVDFRGADVSSARAFVRYLSAGFMYLAVFALIKYIHTACVLGLFVPFFWAIFDKQNRALYDIVAKTRLVLSDPR
jgi:uncharacterized RDD family membrane protein YckC